MRITFVYANQINDANNWRSWWVFAFLLRHVVLFLPCKEGSAYGRKPK
jgi:hypothetical protein